MRIKSIRILPDTNNIEEIINEDSIAANINDISKQAEDFFEQPEEWCFGHYYDPDDIECQSCAAKRFCKKKMAKRGGKV